MQWNKRKKHEDLNKFWWKIITIEIRVDQCEQKQY